MKSYFNKLSLILVILFYIVSCSKEEMIENVPDLLSSEISVDTEIIVDGIVQTNTRASSEAGYTTGDGLYDSGDPVTVTAVANDGYDLVAFYDKKDPTLNLGSSFDFRAKEPRTFKAEFTRKYTIAVSAEPLAGGTVSGGGKYSSGNTCVLSAKTNVGYAFDGWYEGSTKLSSDKSYSFKVLSNRIITAKFFSRKFIIVGDGGYIFSPTKTTYLKCNDDWEYIAHGNGRYVVTGFFGYVTSSVDGLTWTEPKKIETGSSFGIAYGKGKFVAAGTSGYITTSVDGENWTFPLQVGNNHWRNITYGNGMFIAVGNNGYIATSIDGTNWTTPTKVGEMSWQAITYGSGRFVAVGGHTATGLLDEYSSCVATSTDGVNWTAPIQIGRYPWFAVTYGNGRYVAVGDVGYITSSMDGVNWTTPDKIAINSWNGVTYSDGIFVAVGKYGCTYSVDGINWVDYIHLQEAEGGPIRTLLSGICAIQ